MRGPDMTYQLTIPALVGHAARRFAARPIVSRLPDRSIHRTTYGECLARAARLAGALSGLGVVPGDRVATFCWNHYRHLEAYFGIPMAGAVVHTLNLRLHPEDLTYIVRHAEDKVILVDDVLLPLFDKFRAGIGGARVVVIPHGPGVPAGDLDYEELLGWSAPAERDPVTDEDQPAAMCYTSGTTGKPKGVVYSHRGQVLHAIMFASTFGFNEEDTILPVVPLFHANAWGIPYAAVAFGAAIAFPGPHLDPASLCDLIASERVTFAAGVPTIWNGLLQYLDQNPRSDLSSLKRTVCGGSAVPPSLIQAFMERYGIEIIQAWGMTETGPLATVSRPPAWVEASARDRYALRGKQGWPMPLVELRLRGEDDQLAPHDGKSMGEIEIRGAWIAKSYYKGEGADRFTADGWLKTGDVAVMDASGAIELKDRAKDLIKSGGEWISSVALETALVAHPAVADAAVIAIPSARWDERPLALVVLKPGASATGEELKAFLAPRFAKWWLPDGVEFVSELPRTPTGKVLKRQLREEYRNYAPQSDRAALT